MTAYSFSAFNDWKCPLRGQAKRINKWREAETDILQVGKACAEIMADYRHQCVTQGKRSDLSFIDRLIESHPSVDTNIGPDVEQVIRNARDTEIALLDPGMEAVFIEQMFGIAKNGRYWLEKPEQDQWGPYGQVWMRMVPDFMYRLGDVAVVQDDKAGFARGADPFQLDLYAWCAANVYRGTVSQVSVMFNYLRWGYRERFEYRIKDIEKVVPGMIEGTIKHIESLMRKKEFRPDPDAGMCHFCGYVNGWLDKNGGEIPFEPCPAITKELVEMDSLVKAYTVPKIEDDETAIKATRLLVVTDAIISSIKERLGQYVQDHPGSVIEAGGKRPELRKRRQLQVYNVEEAIKFMLSQGIDRQDAWQSLKMGKTDLQSLEKRYPGITEKLEEKDLIHWTETWTFDLYRA